MHTPDKTNNSIEINLNANIGLEMSIVSSKQITEGQKQFDWAPHRFTVNNSNKEVQAKIKASH